MTTSVDPQLYPSLEDPSVFPLRITWTRCPLVNCPSRTSAPATFPSRPLKTACVRADSCEDRTRRVPLLAIGRFVPPQPTGAGVRPSNSMDQMP